MFFGAAMINVTYLLCHLFDDPETGGKYLAMIFLLGMLFGPIALSTIAAAIFGFDSSFSDTISIWYFIDPTLCFGLQLYTLCCIDKPDLVDLRLNLFGDIEPTTGLYCGVMFYQIVIFACINIFVDSWLMNRYKKRGGRTGERPPLLDVRQDVIDHENEVRENAHLLQDAEDSYQIKAVDICKTYPNGQRMAVC
jgi:hypothetical protein